METFKKDNSVPVQPNANRLIPVPLKFKRKSDIQKNAHFSTLFIEILSGFFECVENVKWQNIIQKF